MDDYDGVINRHVSDLERQLASGDDRDSMVGDAEESGNLEGKTEKDDDDPAYEKQDDAPQVFTVSGEPKKRITKADRATSMLSYQECHGPWIHNVRVQIYLRGLKRFLPDCGVSARTMKREIFKYVSPRPGETNKVYSKFALSFHAFRLYGTREKED